MNVDFDEVTWVAERLPETDEPDGVATDRARVALLEHVSATTSRPRRGRGRVGLWRAAVGWVGAIAVTAAAIGVITVAVGSTRPAKPRPTPTRAPAGAAASQHGPVRGHPVLLRLADDVTQAPVPPGNATLVFRHHTFPHDAPFSGYDLYEDNGAYYYGATMDELRGSLSDPGSADKQLGGILSAAARSATLTPAQAATNLYEASPAPSGPPATAAILRATLKKLAGAKAGRMAQLIREKLAASSHGKASVARDSHRPSQATIDNYLWGNCMDALESGAGRADIRAGAMLAVSTLPDVHIRRTTFGGQSVVQVTNTQFADGYAETLDLDAHTGVLVHMSGGTVGKPDSVDVTYRVTRVTVPSLDPAH